jgi:hypothetical protein
MSEETNDKKCDKHPKYTGKNKPKYQCVKCELLYQLLHSQPRVLPKPTKVHKDKSKYTRKEKHKGENSD